MNWERFIQRTLEKHYEEYESRPTRKVTPDKYA